MHLKELFFIRDTFYGIKLLYHNDFFAIASINFLYFFCGVFNFFHSFIYVNSIFFFNLSHPLKWLFVCDFDFASFDLW